MKKILFILLLLSSTLFAKENPNHFVQSKDGVFYITHIVKQESLFEIAKIYQVKPAVLARFNELTYSTTLQANQLIDIPLTETNYYKLSGLSEENGFIKIFYQIEENTNVEYLCDKFQVSIESFCTWNKAVQQTAYKIGQTVMIGWLIYQPNQTPILAAQNNIPKTNILSTGDIRDEGKKSSAKKSSAYHGNEPTLSNSLQKFWSNVKQKTATKSKANKPIQQEDNHTKKQQANSITASSKQTKPIINRELEDTLRTTTKQQSNSIYSKQATSYHKPTFKEDTQDFFNTLKKKLSKKSKSNEVALAKPIKNDPNRTASSRNFLTRKSSSKSIEPKKTTLTLKEKWNRLVNGPEPKTTIKKTTNKPQPISQSSSSKSSSTSTSTKQEITPTPKKKSFKEKWDLLVNGKTAEQKKKLSANEPIAKNQATNNQNNTIHRSTATLNEKKSTQSSQVEKVKNNNTTSTPIKSKKTLKESWNKLVNGKPIEKKTTVEAPKPIVKNKVAEEKKSSEKLTEKKLDKKTETEKNISNKTNTKPTVSSNTKKNIESNLVKNKKNISNKTKEITNNQLNTQAVKEEIVNSLAETKVVAEEKDLTIHSETKHLNLSKSETGKAAYFFAGPNGNKFYVSTNLAKKGDIIKVTNLANGKSLMAEVVSGLSSLDERKGLLIKLSDNAKLPLGQKGSIFSVKINY